MKIKKVVYKNQPKEVDFTTNSSFNWRKKMAKIRRREQTIEILLFSAIVIILIFALIGVISFVNFVKSQFQNEKPKQASQVEVVIVGEQNEPLVGQPVKPNLSAEGEKGIIREITMYTSREAETDDSPCISADGTNICQVDYAVCASNAFPLGTKLMIDKLGECLVKDRMNARYTQAVDYYVKFDLTRAISFGRQRLAVRIIK